MTKTKIRDTDYLTSTMRVRVLERSLLSRERVLRMVEAKSHEEALKVLAECGYAEPEEETPAALERRLRSARTSLYALAAEFLKDKRMLDVFRCRYDYHNLKTLVKAEAVGETAARLLSEDGRVPVKQLVDAYPDFISSKYPKVMSEAVLNARDLLARTQDPQMSDFLLDRTCLREMSQLANDSGCAFLADYVSLSIDASNLKSVVRADRIGKGPDFLRLVLCEGGKISLHRLSQMLISGGSLPELYASTPLQKAAEEGVPAMRGEIGLTAFERLVDNALTGYLMKAKYTPFGPEPVLAYLLARENEQTTIRTVMNGRFSGVPQEEIRERLRESYV